MELPIRITRSATLKNGGVDMKRQTICFALLFLVLVSNTAFAANWVYYGRSAIVRGNVFIDSDSVYKSGDNASYWELLVYDKPIGTAAKLTTKTLHHFLQFTLAINVNLLILLSIALKFSSIKRNNNLLTDFSLNFYTQKARQLTINSNNPIILNK